MRTSAQRERLSARAALLSLGVFLVTSEASALDQDDAERIGIEYSAAGECPSGDELVRRIASYTKKWTLAQPEEPVRRFVVKIARRDDRYVGRLDVRGPPGGNAATREIPAETCDDVVLGFAIAVAIAIDPRAALAPETAVTSVPDEPETSDAKPPPPELAPEQPPRPAPEKPKRRPPAAAPVSRLAPSIGARAEANTAVSGLLAVVDLYAELEWRAPVSSPHGAPIARHPALRPVLRAGFRKSFTRTSRVGPAEADIDWSAGTIELCPSRFIIASQLSIEGCLGSNIGVLAAKARDIPGAGTTYRFWFG